MGQAAGFWLQGIVTWFVRVAKIAAFAIALVAAQIALPPPGSHGTFSILAQAAPNTNVNLVAGNAIAQSANITVANGGSVTVTITGGTPGVVLAVAFALQPVGTITIQPDGTGSLSGTVNS